MKILHVTQGYYPALGGTEVAIQRISEELVHQFGHDVTVFTTNCYSGEAFNNPRLPRMDSGWETINGVKVRRFSVNSRASRFFRYFQALRTPGNQHFRTLYQGPIIPGLARAIKNTQFDILAASSFPLNHMYVSLKAAHKLGRPCVLIGGLHPQDEWGYQRPMIYKAIQEADSYIGYTQFETDYVIRRGANPDKVKTIGLGVDPRPFEKTNSSDAKKRLGLGDEEPLIGYIGQLGWHKGVDTLLRAMPIVWQVIPQAKLLIAGAKATFADHMEHYIAQLSPEDQAKIILHYNFSNDEKPWLYAAVDVFAYPSGLESFGISYCEAWAVKKPVIGCKGGAVPWVITSGRDGLLVEFQNEIMLGEAIITLLDNPNWAMQLGETGYQKVINVYNWSEAGRRFNQTYVDTIKNL